VQDLTLDLVAAQAPERLSKLLLFHAFSRPNDAHLKTSREWVDLIDKNQLASFLHNSLNDAVHPQRLEHPEFVDSLYAMQQAFPLEGRRNQLQAIINDYETASLLPNIACPALAVHGREDPVFSLEEQQYIAQHVKGANLAIIEEYGHMGPMEQPQAVTALMRLRLSNWCMKHFSRQAALAGPGSVSDIGFRDCLCLELLAE